MPKKPAQTKPKTSPQPEPAQLKAIDRLLENEDYRGAIGKITPLLRRFPDHGGLHRALVEALDQSGDERAAGLAAFAWSEHRPNSLPAQEALLHFATVLGHLMLAEDTARKVRELGGETPGFPIDPNLKEAMLVQPDGSRKGDAAAELDALTASNVYLRALYLGGDESFRGLIAFVLRHRAESSDTDAARLLRELSTLPVGTKGERLREIKVASTEVYREAKESDLPPDLEALLAEAVTLFNEQLPDEAEARLQAILERVPDHPVPLGNLAAARNMQGRHAEARDLLRRVVVRHPDYLFARCNLARTLIEKGDLDEAEQLLDGLAERERLHIQEVFTVYGALAMLYKARGDHDAAKSVLASLEEMVEDEDDERRLAQAKRAVTGLDPMEGFREVFGDLLKSGPRPDTRLR